MEKEPNTSVEPVSENGESGIEAGNNNVITEPAEEVPVFAENNDGRPSEADDQREIARLRRELGLSDDSVPAVPDEEEPNIVLEQSADDAEFAETIGEQEKAVISKSGREKLHSLYSDGLYSSPEYEQLSSLLLNRENNQQAWKPDAGIDFGAVKNLLERMDREEARAENLKWQKEEDEKDRQRAEIRKKKWEESGSTIPEIDSSMTPLSLGEEGYRKYIEQIKNLSPDETVYLYHGLNSGGYNAVLDVLNSPSRGVEQRSGPTVSLAPVGQFWKGMGFRYALKRGQIAFPGEDNPNAVVRMAGESGVEDSGYITAPNGSLPLDQFHGEVMRSAFANPDAEADKVLSDRLKELAEAKALPKTEAEES